MPEHAARNRGGFMVKSVITDCAPVTVVEQLKTSRQAQSNFRKSNICS